MCGLIGVVAAHNPQIGSRVDSGLAALQHRGPNHQEARVFEVAGREVWLGHTRLSVIDLDSGANQPMCTDDGRFVMIFNGEIYNYVELREQLRTLGAEFHTKSDTEVLLTAWARWGDTCLDRLDGMFAFAVLDRSLGTVTCVRDPFGIKPFFYSVQDGAFYFASELPAILGLLPGKLRPDLQTAYDYLVHGDYDSNERTFVDGVRHLMPAHVMTLDVGSGTVTSARHWWSPTVEQTSTLSFEDAAEAVREQFLQNVRRQLRSDVPLGVALSGGIDSSAVVCAIRHLEPDLPIHTFSFVASDPAISEERWVDLVNHHAGAIPHKARATAEELVRDIDDLVWAQGEPFGSTSIYAQYRVFKLARQSGITVTLEGQGADELLAGYHGYPGYRLLSLLSEWRGVQAWRFARRWRTGPGRSYKQIGLDFARSLLPDGAYARVRAMQGRAFVPTWMNAAPFREAGVRFIEHRRRGQPAPIGRRLVRHLGASLQYRGLPSLLRRGDRSSMHSSIESRVPFLTTGLCDLLYSLPEEFLISPAGETKSVFRAAMRGIVPDSILDRRDKIGFATPERAWSERVAPVLRGWLKDADTTPLLNTAKTVELFDSVMSGSRPFSWQIWRLVNYVRWQTLVSANR